MADDPRTGPAGAAFLIRVLGLFAMFPHDLCDVLRWRTDGEYAPVTFLVDCSDDFAWGGADCEALTGDADLDALEAALAEVAAAEPRYPLYGTTLWVARKRGMRPQGAAYPEDAPGVWPLFDACGPLTVLSGQLPTGEVVVHDPRDVVPSAEQVAKNRPEAVAE